MSTHNICIYKENQVKKIAQTSRNKPFADFIYLFIFVKVYP